MEGPARWAGTVRSKAWLPGPGGRAVFPGERKSNAPPQLGACSPRPGAHQVTGCLTHTPGSGLPTRGHPPHSTLLPAPSEPCPTQTAHQFQGKLQTLLSGLKAVHHAAEEAPSLSSHFCFAPNLKAAVTPQTHIHIHTLRRLHTMVSRLTHVCFPISAFFRVSRPGRPIPMPPAETPWRE